MKVNVTELIKKAIEDTANRFGNSEIRTAEDMIPHMRTITKEEEYPRRYIENVKYDKSEDALMDIYYPDESIKGPYPVFIEVHGGAWYFGQKSSIEFKPFLEGTKRGYVCVSLGYTLSPKAVYPQAVQEIKRAVMYLKEHADRLDIDREKIALWGGSAGAHLAALAAYSEDTGYLRCELENEFMPEAKSKNPTEKRADAKVNVLALWYGCYDYFIGKRLDEWIYKNFFGTEDLESVREQMILANPICHIKENAPYTLLQHGINDMLVPYEQSVYLHSVITGVAGVNRCRLDLIEGADHADAKLFAKNNIEKVFDYIDEKIGKM